MVEIHMRIPLAWGFHELPAHKGAPHRCENLGCYVTVHDDVLICYAGGFADELGTRCHVERPHVVCTRDNKDSRDLAVLRNFNHLAVLRYFNHARAAER